MDRIAHRHSTATRYALDAVQDDQDHVEAALACFSPLIHGVRWRRRVSPHLADAHQALTRAAIGLRRLRRACELELGR